MDSTASPEGRAGRFVTIDAGQHAFVPHSLPPSLRLSEQLVSVLANAERAFGGVASIADFLPRAQLLVTPFLSLEAALSSRIEGTQTTPAQLLEAVLEPEAEIPPQQREVVNYLRALEAGMALLHEIPLCLRSVWSLHSELLKGVRGAQRAPGEFRKTQVHIGPSGAPITQAYYIPPPPHLVAELMGDWEKYLNAPSQVSPLVHCAIMHAQFEMIHPFLDGNGRVARLVIPLLLMATTELSQPLLFLSAFFERHRQEYYDRLLGISQHGDWEGWVEFFLRAVETQSLQALISARFILALRDTTRAQLQEVGAQSHVLALLDCLFQNPFTTVTRAARQLDIPYPRASRAVRKLEQLGFLKETTGRARSRRYVASPVLQIIESATAPFEHDDRG